MAFTVSVTVDRTIEVACDVASAFALVSDVPKSVSHLPKVERLTDLGGGAYRLETEKIGIEKHNLQTIYASQYVHDAKKKTVTAAAPGAAQPAAAPAAASAPKPQTQQVLAPNAASASQSGGNPPAKKAAKA